MKVEVDLKDLETIIYASAAIKSIEAALAGRQHDPFVKPHLQYTEAHNNLVFAMNSARRKTADTVIPWEGELSDSEIRFLHDLDKQKIIEIQSEERSVDRGFHIVDVLAAK